MTFTVYGLPQPAGSKRAFPFKRKDGRLGVNVTDANPKGKGWKQEIAYAAQRAKVHVHQGPVALKVAFYLPRPKGHFGTGRNAGKVRDSAPARPTVKPDLLKLARALEDALTGIAWADDAQIVCEMLSKDYTANPWDDALTAKVTGPYCTITINEHGPYCTRRSDRLRDVEQGLHR